jgi:beta-glucanase (GH16 family)
MTRSLVVLIPAALLGMAVAVAVAENGSSPEEGLCVQHPTHSKCRTSSRSTIPSSTIPSSVRTANPPVPAGVPGNWTLKFDEEFSGTGLDTTKWQPGWFGSGITDGFGKECNDSRNVSVYGGDLSILAEARQSTCPSGTHPYRSALISSNPAVVSPGAQFLYGVFEARLHLPDAATGQVNNWPAWWIANEHNGTHPEIDIFEAGRGGSGTYHVHMPSSTSGGTVPGDWTGWHTYAINWQPSGVDWYWDGRKVASVASPIPSTPLFLIVNQSVGYARCSCRGPIVVPNTILVDYVRVWQ